jgi:uncharacterized membrane protein YqaE (UPF0057 family)
VAGADPAGAPPRLPAAAVRDGDLSGRLRGYMRGVTVLEIIIALFLPFLAVLLKKGPTKEVLIAFLLQLLGHIPGVIYAIFVVTAE